jgi:type II secretory pathway component GspD/PulD (secretin)
LPNFKDASALPLPAASASAAIALDPSDSAAYDLRAISSSSAGSSIRSVIMRPIVHFLAISLSLLLGVHSLSAMDAAPQPNAQNVQYCARMSRRAMRHQRVIGDVAASAEQRPSADRNLPIRVYHLDYVKSKDIAAMTKALLSKNGTIDASPDAKLGGGSATGGETLIAQDYEEVLKKIDRVIAQIDVQPLQVLIEAEIIQVALNRDHIRSGVTFAPLDAARKTSNDVGNGEINGTAVRFRPASFSFLTRNGEVVGGATREAKPAFIGFCGHRKPAELIRAMEQFGTTKVLAAPRVLVLNKQLADLCLGQPLVYQTTTVTPTGATIKKPEQINIGTELQARPFISSDGMIRMEVKLKRSTGHLDELGVPQTNTTEIQANVMIPDGTTVVAVGPIHSEVPQVLDDLSVASWIPWMFPDMEDCVTEEQQVVLLTAHVWKP